MMRMIENQVFLAQGAYARVIGGSDKLLALCRGMHYALVEIYVLTQTAAAYERLGKRREAAALVRQAADMARPDGLVLPFAACYRYLREVLPEVEDLPDFFANKAGVLLEGGDGLFVGNARGHIRLNLAMPRATVQTGLERIAEAIRKETAGA